MFFFYLLQGAIISSSALFFVASIKAMIKEDEREEREIASIVSFYTGCVFVYAMINLIFQ